jgi:hypothetical protein
MFILLELIRIIRVKLYKVINDIILCDFFFFLKILFIVCFNRIRLDLKWFRIKIIIIKIATTNCIFILLNCFMLSRVQSMVIIRVFKLLVSGRSFRILKRQNNLFKIILWIGSRINHIPHIIILNTHLRSRRNFARAVVSSASSIDRFNLILIKRISGENFII